MADGQVVFEITGDNSKLKQSLQDTTREIDSESKKWDGAVDNSSGKISDSMIGAFKAVVASSAFSKITQMLISLGVDGIQVASDLEEVQNVVDITFGEAGARKIENWANEASKNFGLTELQAKRYSSTIGAMMKSSGMAEGDITDMSMSLAGLAADMASFYNMDFDTAFQKIQSGMTGMSQPMRQLGINMTETSVAAFAAANGFETEYSKMSEAEHMIVRYQYLMQATADAQGDFARTSDSYANSQRRVATGIESLKAQVGEALLPIVSTISDAIGDLLELLLYAPPETVFDTAEESMANAAGQAAEAQGILGYMDKLMEKYGVSATETNEWAEALERLKTVFPEVNKYIEDETGKLTATNEQLKQYVENSKQAAIEDAKKAAISSLNEQYIQAGKDYYTAEINRDIAQEEMNSAREGIVNFIRSLNGYQDFTDDGSKTTGELTLLAKEMASATGESTAAIDELDRVYYEQLDVVKASETEMGNLQSKMQSLQAELDIANQALERLAAAAASASAATFASEASDGSHAGGLDFVPFDGYRAILHKGERIQTAAEANLMRQYGMQQPGFDYATLGGVMRDNIKAGGDVYLDGRTVGRVISDIQGKSYRALQRSGWQQ